MPLFLGSFLYVFLYRGANWARWITGVSLALSGLGALYGFVLSVSAGESWLLGWANAMIALIHLGSVYVLFFVQSVRAHFGHDSNAATRPV